MKNMRYVPQVAQLKYLIASNLLQQLDSTTTVRSQMTRSVVAAKYIILLNISPLTIRVPQILFAL